jgi:GNAT superfamily N-acetyltransferase
MTLPDAARLYDVIAATWPAAAAHEVGPWLIRDGQGGGSRVSSAIATGPVKRGDIAQLAETMRSLAQPQLVMIRAGEDTLDEMLAQAGFVVKDPVVIFAAPVDAIAKQRPPPITSFAVWPPLATQAEIWAAGGVGPARLAVMERAPAPKTTLLGRSGERPAGTLFVGIDQDCAMIHALEIGPGFRRKGLARHLTHAAAFWAKANGAAYLSLVTTRANMAAIALYTSLGFSIVGHYHYRILPQEDQR